jgi:hypothetical protein
LGDEVLEIELAELAVLGEEEGDGLLVELSVGGDGELGRVVAALLEILVAGGAPRRESRSMAMATCARSAMER